MARIPLSTAFFLLAAILATPLFAACSNASAHPEPAVAMVQVFEETAAVEESVIDVLAVSVPEPPPPSEPEHLFPLPLAWAGPPLRVNQTPPPNITAKAAIVIDEASGAVLFEKDAHLPLPPASLTKIATAILALQHGDLDAWVEIDVDSRLMRGSTLMGLLPGDRFRLRDLLYGLMLSSGNDAALAIGRHIAGSDEAFVAMMNDLSLSLGLASSHYIDPHGLGGPGHHASAYDLAMLARHAMSVPGFYDIVTARQWVARGSRTLVVRNINTFLTGYNGADGIKTGYTGPAGRTIVSSATRNGHRLYAVVLNSQARDEDARRLLNWAFSGFNWEQH